MIEPSQDRGPEAGRDSGPAPGPGRGPDAGTGRSIVRRLLPAAVLVAGLALFFLLGGQRYVGLHSLEANRDALKALVAAHPVGAVAAFIALYALMAAFSIPGAAVMTTASGFLFGIVVGAASSVIGATLGGIAVFLVARTAVGDLLRDRAGPAVARMRAGFQENALSYLLVLRLIPLFPFWLVNLVPAFLGVSLRVFAVGTLLGIIPGSLVYASLGNGLDALLEAGRTDHIDEAIYQPEVLLPIVGLIVLALLPVAYKKLRQGRARNSGGKGHDNG